MNYTIRKMKKSEYGLLDDFLYEAIYIPNEIEPPPKSIIYKPELQVYISNFGSSKHDHALVAVVNKKVVGAVWCRIMNDYGHIDNNTPSLAISLYKEYRGFGIGTQLVKKMLLMLKKYNYKQISLSVQKDNYAVKLYKNVGFQIFSENTQEYIMISSIS